MAEDIKQEEKKTDSKSLSTIFKFLLGLVFLGLGAYLALIVWRSELLSLIKGSVGIFLVLAGIITLAIAKE